jgi:hypothetical protein
VSQAISHDLRVQYGADYSVLSRDIGAQALKYSRLVLRNRPWHWSTDQRMPEMGIEMLATRGAALDASSCCSPHTPTPMSRSARSATSV